MVLIYLLYNKYLLENSVDSLWALVVTMRRGQSLCPCLDSLGFVHETVNHSKEFKSRTGVCTNRIELYWKRLKQYCRQTSVLSLKFLPEDIDEFMCKERMPTAGLFGTFIGHLEE